MMISQDDLVRLEFLISLGVFFAIVGPLVAKGRWQSSAHKPMPKALERWTWIFFGVLGLALIIAALVIVVFHPRF